jgi:hypothetical protein
VLIDHRQRVHAGRNIEFELMEQLCVTCVLLIEVPMQCRIPISIHGLEHHAATLRAQIDWNVNARLGIGIEKIDGAAARRQCAPTI